LNVKNINPKPEIRNQNWSYYILFCIENLCNFAGI